jgi:hypothetical protein
MKREPEAQTAEICAGEDLIFKLTFRPGVKAHDPQDGRSFDILKLTGWRDLGEGRRAALPDAEAWDFVERNWQEIEAKAIEAVI